MRLTKLTIFPGFAQLGDREETGPVWTWKVLHKLYKTSSVKFDNTSGFFWRLERRKMPYNFQLNIFLRVNKASNSSCHECDNHSCQAFVVCQQRTPKNVSKPGTKRQTRLQPWRTCPSSETDCIVWIKSLYYSESNSKIIARPPAIVHPASGT